MECIFYHSGFLSNSAVALKNRVAQKFFTVLKTIFRFSNLRLPWKTELPWNFSLYWNICYHSGFLSNWCLPEMITEPECRSWLRPEFAFWTGAGAGVNIKYCAGANQKF